MSRALLPVKAARRPRGFTLVEVVVSTVILSLIMLATATALRTFGQTYDRLLGATDRSADAREVTRFLNLSLRDALPNTATMQGSRTELQWVAPLDRVGSAGGLQHLRLRQMGDALVLSFAPYSLLDAGGSEPRWASVVEDFVLIESLESLEFAFFVDPYSDPISSFDGDNTSPTIPFAVGIDLRVSGRNWPPIIIALEGYPQ